MLYDPKWEQQTEADPFALATFIAWLEKQPADETYCYTSVGHCLVAQYLNAHGLRTTNVNPVGFYRNGDLVCLPNHLNRIAVKKPHTFGAALARARAYSHY